MSLTYYSYLKLDQLLDLQEPKSDPVEHDEMLFIVIHQVYELWFKQLLHEVDKIKRDFTRNGELFGAHRHVQPCAHHPEDAGGATGRILETMTPLSFAAFRDRLDTASGFQSAPVSRAGVRPRIQASRAC